MPNQTSRTIDIRSNQMAGGISQQPPQVRFPGQVTDANNAVFNVVDGVSKRPGTQYVKRLTTGLGLSVGGDYRLHPIDRDSTEQYLAVYGYNTLRIWHVDGTEATVSPSGAAVTYFDLNTPTASDLVLLSIADYTMVGNRKVAMATAATASYTVTAEWTDYTRMTATTPSDETYHKTNASVAGAPAGYWFYDVDGNTFSTIRFAEVVSAYEAIGNVNGFSAGTWSNAADSITKTAAFTNYTHAAGDQVYIASGTGFTAGWQTILSKTNNNTIVINSLAIADASDLVVSGFRRVKVGNSDAVPGGVWDDAGSKGFKIRFEKRQDTFTGASWNNSTKVLTKTNAWSGYSWQSGDQMYISSGTGFTAGWYGIVEKQSASALLLEDSINVANTSDVAGAGIGQQFDVVFPGTTGTLPDMESVAAYVQGKMRSAGAAESLCAWTSTGTGRGYFTITSPWRGSGSKVTSVTTNPSAPSTGVDLSAAGMPFSPLGCTITNGAGSGPRTLPVIDRWTQVPAPADPDGALDNTTMPLKMVRTVIGPPATFTLNLTTWTARTSGDKDSNPSPSVFQNGYALSDMCFHRGRFGLAAGERLCLSSPNDFFNFYLADFNQVVDSDPIDVSLSSDRVTVIDYVLPFRDTLTVYTKSGRQFELNAPEALTPETASFTASTAFSTLSVRPKTLGASAVFLGTNDTSTQLLETTFESKLIPTDATNVSAHTPSLLPSGIRSIVVHPNTRQVFVLPSGGSNKVYVYRSFYNGSVKVQSAWSKYTFDSSYSICDIAVIRDNLYLLVQSESQFFLEKLPVVPQQASTFQGSAGGTGWPFPVCMDRMFFLTGVHSAGTTTWTLPNTSSDTTLNTAVLGPAFGGSAGTIVAVTQHGTTVTASGNYSAGVAAIGRTYPFSTELSQPFARDQRGQAELDEVLVQQRLDINHIASGDYTVRLRREDATDYSQAFAPPSGSATSTGVFQAWPVGRVDINSTFIESTNAKPVTVAGLQHVCETANIGR